jgi:hypothetical protein
MKSRLEPWWAPLGRGAAAISHLGVKLPVAAGSAVMDIFGLHEEGKVARVVAKEGKKMFERVIMRVALHQKDS